ncbi:hypothetical protein PPERSA_00564 [Pseudocohnilembus persalinus]|uniref:t-SNARE coiled-coil homology domain-containing protein n=1 Tax=Pseudocohnilembus persalinus TaxID=266149 RepID=A0A0V0QSJ2_PSEPJ|nr:hypothetical protein PPERSA_00564 [Pseudocohnilembus persalinus]|eukprot:KRX05263.1 hypothetical protein PPERSA_00564 [Pseudocohnilembus persalinus]
MFIQFTNQKELIQLNKNQKIYRKYKIFQKKILIIQILQLKTRIHLKKYLKIKMSENFNSQLENARRLTRSLNQDIEKKKKMMAQGKGTGILDMEIKGQVNKLENEMKYIDDSLKKLRTDPEINQGQLNKITNFYNEVLNEKNDAIAKFQNANDSQPQAQVINFQTKQNFQDKYDAQNMTQEQLYQAQQAESQQTDAKLDQLINVTGQITYVAKTTNKELHEQDKMLNELEYGMDTNTNKMEKTGNKMKRLLQSSSNCKLMVAIFIELGLKNSLDYYINK